jgi:hypothetical protein
MHYFAFFLKTECVLGMLWSTNEGRYRCSICIPSTEMCQRAYEYIYEKHNQVTHRGIRYI